ncbi:hypothetical protein HMPREF9720_1496 [Alistipes sp. HGB5]|nr:hypothetical protein HMPREF9720_1496 [Alistipes sp. HGB5]
MERRAGRSVRLLSESAASAKLHVKLMLIFGGKTVSSGKMA